MCFLAASTQCVKPTIFHGALPMCLLIQGQRADLHHRHSIKTTPNYQHHVWDTRGLPVTRNTHRSW